MIAEIISLKRAWQIVQDCWARSMVAVILFVLGLWIGGVNAEGKIAADCKFAGAFRVDIQAFSCIRKI